MIRIRPLLTAEAFDAARAGDWSTSLTNVLSEANDLAATVATST